ncbi:MAG: hypothetical protein AB7O91_09320 [Sphingomonas sp.]
MKSIPALIAVAAAVSVTGLASAQPPDREAELAEILEGWTQSGPPERCIQVRRARILRIVNQTAVVYRLGGTLYVNRPRGGVQYLDRRDALVNRRGSTLLCDGEMMESADPYSSVVRLITSGPFVPYRRDD